MKTFYLIVIDGLGCGAQEDAHEYGDVGANTLGHVVNQTQLKLPNFEKLGLGNIIPLDTIAPVLNPPASYGKMREISAGKDSTTGHWEIAGHPLDKPFPTYPKGFPSSVLEAFLMETGNKGYLCNLPYSGTAVIEEYGKQHLDTGFPIIYTSADSVFQIATHTDVTSLETLYEWCEIAREKVTIGEHGVGRVIARPFKGSAGNFQRISDKRKDFSFEPYKPTLNTVLQSAGVETVSIGKVIDLFAGHGFERYTKTEDNAEGLKVLLNEMQRTPESDRFVFVNLIDTDQLFGHRNDVPGYAASLKAIDDALPKLLENVGDEDAILFLGDHGNDPAYPSTDHQREFVPVLVLDKKNPVGSDIGTRNGFYDVAVSVSEWFGVEHPFPGVSFL